MNVLVADDDPTTRLLLKRMLIRDFDCAVTEVQNGMEALAALDERRYSALLLDVHMPVMGGLEALEAIRGSAHSSLPVVMLTAERGAAVVKRAVALGITDYLVKPLRPKRIGERLARRKGHHRGDSRHLGRLSRGPGPASSGRADGAREPLILSAPKEPRADISQ